MTYRHVDALAEFLNITNPEAEQLLDEGDYLCLTEEEADEEARKEILNSLWAFNADFIIQHCKNYDKMDCYEYKAAVKSLQDAQSKQCESLNGLCAALIDDIDEFIEDAINADGRGHFISYYDGRENEIYYDGETFYIYRLN